MCVSTSFAPDGRRAAILLAEEMKRALGVNVDPRALRDWVATRFDRIAPLAHAIHGEREIATSMAAAAKENLQLYGGRLI
jgi:hypothetical protein